ncbi:MAG: hypothetical protein ACP5E2_16190, partial [Terracidiphilus sp.]
QRLSSPTKVVPLLQIVLPASFSAACEAVPFQNPTFDAGCYRCADPAERLYLVADADMLSIA